MVNRMRATKGHRNNRRANIKIVSPALTKDDKGTVHISHRASPTTGEYRGRQVVDVMKKTLKKQAKKAPVTEAPKKEKKEKKAKVEKKK